MFGDRVRELRIRAGLTQSQVAERIGVSNTYVSALESGRKAAPPHAVVVALSTCLAVDEAELWRLARAEREERLRRRIAGVPTSQRFYVVEPAGPPADDPQPDDGLDRAFGALMDTVKTPKERRVLADVLEALARSLRKAD